jgi:hypothetical protein
VEVPAPLRVVGVPRRVGQRPFGSVYDHPWTAAGGDRLDGMCDTCPHTQLTRSSRGVNSPLVKITELDLSAKDRRFGLGGCPRLTFMTLKTVAELSSLTSLTLCRSVSVRTLPSPPRAWG